MLKWYDSRIIILSGDTETNPGTKHSFSSQGLNICHWNLNSLSSHMFKNFSLLSAFISVHKLDSICLSETYLNSETSPDDDILEIPGYNDEFESFLEIFKLTLDKIHDDNPFMISVLGDFNAKSSKWCKNDITFHEGSMIDAITSNYGLHQLIQEPTHILNFSSSCIDLIFTSQSNFVMESGAYSSLHPTGHHQITFAKFSLFLLYPPPYERTVWFFEKANPQLIRRAINEFDWTRALSNVIIDKKICYFTETLLNIIHNFT